METGADYCAVCGAPVSGVVQPLELVLPDNTRVPLVEPVEIGRAATNTLELADPTVSRHHARIRPQAAGAALIEDAGSSYGTWLDGRQLSAPARLEDGSRIRLGNQELRVERRRPEGTAGKTLVVSADAVRTHATDFGQRPRLRAGYALKRLAADEGDRRWVLKDLNNDSFVRLSDEDAQLLTPLDGNHPLDELVRAAEQQLGPAGPARLAGLLADLGERGMLEGSSSTDRADAQDSSRLRRLSRPRSLAWKGVGAVFERLYARGGWVLFTDPALVSLAVLAITGLIVFFYLLTARYGTPFVVASRVGLGGLVFLLGRFAVAAVHESAHGLTMAAVGRRVREAGLKVVWIFPYAYVDTSDVWFEPRKRRIAVSAAGPVSDLSLGGAFSLLCLMLPPGATRDILFQLAFGAYIGAFFNLNPLLERDGYHMLVDYFREPDLRRRAREQFERRLTGGGRRSDSRSLTRYSLLGLAWSLAGASFGVVMALRYEDRITQVAPGFVAWMVLAVASITVLLPVLLMLGRPVLGRLGRGGG